jgi:hypothetical protein
MGEEPVNPNAYPKEMNYCVLLTLEIYFELFELRDCKFNFHLFCRKGLT